MNAIDYLIDSALVLLVLVQIKERPLTVRSLLRPVLLVGVAVIEYATAIPTAGNDIVLIVALMLIGAAIGIGCAVTVQLRVGGDGVVRSRAGLVSAALWILGMGSRFAFIVWITHGGASWFERFNQQHDITSVAAWTMALLAMAVFEVMARSLVLLQRRRALVTTHDARQVVA